jgi:hypothetical protein
MDSEIIYKDQEINKRESTAEEFPKNKNIARNRLPPEGVLMAAVDKPREIITVRPKPKVDFSIEAILSSRTSAPSAIVVTSSEIFNSESKSRSINDHSDPNFSWVYCTRYRPPKLPRE